MKIKPGIQVVGVAFEENDPELVYVRRPLSSSLLKERDKITIYNHTKKGNDGYYYIYGTDQIFVMNGCIEYDPNRTKIYKAKRPSYYLKGKAEDITITVTKKFLLFFSSTIEKNIPLKYLILSEAPIPDIYVWITQQFRANLLGNMNEVLIAINDPNVPLHAMMWQGSSDREYNRVSSMWIYLTHDYYKDIVWLLDLTARNGVWSREIVRFANQVRPGWIKNGLGYSEIIPPLFIFMVLQNAVEKSLLTWDSFNKTSPDRCYDLIKQLLFLQFIIVGENNKNPDPSSIEELLEAVQSAIKEDKNIRQLMSMMAKYLGLSVRSE